MLTTDPEESLLGDVHVRGGRRSCRRPTRGSDVVATDVMPSDLGSSFGARKPKTSFASSTEHWAHVSHEALSSRSKSERPLNETKVECVSEASLSVLP